MKRDPWSRSVIFIDCKICPRHLRRANTTLKEFLYANPEVKSKSLDQVGGVSCTVLAACFPVRGITFVFRIFSWNAHATNPPIPVTAPHIPRFRCCRKGGT